MIEKERIKLSVERKRELLDSRKENEREIKVQERKREKVKGRGST